jgi:hypothetical protein
MTSVLIKTKRSFKTNSKEREGEREGKVLYLTTMSMSKNARAIPVIEE